MGCGSSKKVPPIETGAQEKPVAPPLEQEKPVAPPPEQEKPVAPPPEQEKPVAPPPPPLSLRIVPSPTPPPGQKASSKAAPPDFSPLIKQNLVLPDELEGPYVLSKYHKNWRGRGRGFFEEAGEDKWGDSNREKMKKWESWGSIDWDHPDAPDPDFALESGSVGGKGLNIKELRPSIIAAQREMVQVYTAAFERAVAKPGAAAAFEKITQLEERRNKERQPGGRDLDIFGLFKGALGAIGELWAYGLEVREASGEHDAGLSWGIKKAVRTRCWHTLRCDTLSHAVVDTMRVDTLRGDTLLHAVVDTLRVDTLRGDTLLVTRCVLTRCVATRCYTLLVTRCVLSRYAVCMYEDGGEMNTTNDFDFKPFRRFTRCALTRCYMLHAVGHTLLVTRCLFFLQAVVDTLHAVGAFSSKLYFFTRSCGHTL